MNEHSEKKWVLITGASRGIGKALAQDLLKRGYAVHLTARSTQDLEAVRAELCSLGPVATSVFDVADREALQAFCNTWTTPLYGIINNAGICITEHLSEKLDPSRTFPNWDRVLEVNLSAPFFLSKGLLPHLCDNGRIINMSSQLGKEGRGGYSAYCASKFGLIGVTKCLAKELGSRGITVNAICPGWVNTDQAKGDMARLALELGRDPEAYYDEVCAPLELKRFIEPEEVAALTAFLLSPESSGITGRDWLMATIWNQE